jgi:hypothetical protein
MNFNRFGLGLALALIGGALLYGAFAMDTGDGMFGGIVVRAPAGALAVVLVIPGLAGIAGCAVKRRWREARTTCTSRAS